VADEVQLPEPAANLLAVAEAVSAGWVRRSVESAARVAGADPGDWPGVEELAERVATDLLDRLRALLATDVDAQRTNPLSIYRSSVVEPTAYLRERGVPLPRPDGFAAERFPDDPYRLGPATWSDVDPELHAPGLTWGAWKAMVVLERRRAEGLR
jgi:hypothetical protein